MEESTGGDIALLLFGTSTLIVRPGCKIVVNVYGDVELFNRGPSDCGNGVRVSLSTDSFVSAANDIRDELRVSTNAVERMASRVVIEVRILVEISLQLS